MRLSILVLAVFLFSFVSAVVPDDCSENMISYWMFNDNSDEEINGYDGEGFDGTYGDFTPDYSSRCVIFDGSNSVTIEDTDDLRISGNEGSTINFWFSKGQGNPSFWVDGDLVVKENSYEIRWVDDMGSVGGYVNATYAGFSIQTSNLDKNKPYFISVVHNISHLMIYVDGELDSSFAYGAGSSTKLSSTNYNDIYFGEGFEGKIDEVSFYDVPLTDTEIHLLYVRSSAGKDYCAMSGGTSSGTRTIFSIDGCVNGEESVYLSSCSRSGKYYCDEFGDLKNTLRDGDVCDSSSTNPCCPGGYECREATSEDVGYTLGEDYCFQSIVNCGSFDDEGVCASNGCFWIEDSDGDGFCSGSSGDFSCSFYDTSDSCEEDIWRLGTSGIGTDICGAFVDTSFGITYTIRDCACNWVDDSTGCVLSYESVPQVHSGTDIEGITCEKSLVRLAVL